MKHTFSIIIITLLSWLGAIPHARAQTSLEEARRAIAASNAIYFQSFAKNDSSIFIDRYADDAYILAPDAPPFVGRAGALTFFRLAYDKIGLRNGKFITTKIYGLGNEYVTEEGLWQSFDAKGKLFDDGYLTYIYFRQTHRICDLFFWLPW